jgi:hypothetical protein
MARVHIAQIDYRPAYYDPPVDFLEEPIKDSNHALGKLRRFPEIESHLRQSRDAYVKLICRKIDAISQFSASRRADILNFPEYSVPIEALPELRKRSKEASLVIVAGTHRVAISDRARDIYKSTELPILDEHVGAAICPIFLPSQPPLIVAKASRSKWEGSLLIPNPLPRSAIEIQLAGTKMTLFVLVCLDALNADQLGQIKAVNVAPSLVVCPSLSPSTGEFESAAQIVSLLPSLFAYANCSKYGDSQFYIPSKWQP